MPRHRPRAPSRPSTEAVAAPGRRAQFVIAPAGGRNHLAVAVSAFRVDQPERVDRHAVREVPVRLAHFILRREHQAAFRVRREPAQVFGILAPPCGLFVLRGCWPSPPARGTTPSGRPGRGCCSASARHAGVVEDPGEEESASFSRPWASGCSIAQAGAHLSAPGIGPLPQEAGIARVAPVLGK